MKNFNSILCVLVMAMFMGIAWFETVSVWSAGDTMVGFVFVFALLLTALVFIVGIVWAAITRSWSLAIACVLGGCIAVSPFLLAPRLSEASWVSAISNFSEQNQKALAQVDFSDSDYSDGTGFYAMTLVEIPGFAWHCEHRIAASEGVFKGFAIDSIPHVFVAKIRHGAKGLAWIDDEQRVPGGSGLSYSYTGIDRWYIWQF
ncbi:hypothetical protein OAG68_02725 [bacterium]|nr:hypothetical protein [bacterium]